MSQQKSDGWKNADPRELIRRDRELFKLGLHGLQDLEKSELIRIVQVNEE